jgi:hypothetical protein
MAVSSNEILPRVRLPKARKFPQLDDVVEVEGGDRESSTISETGTNFCDEISTTCRIHGNRSPFYMNAEHLPPVRR